MVNGEPAMMKVEGKSVKPLLVSKKGAVHLLGGASARTMDYPIARCTLRGRKIGRRTKVSDAAIRHLARTGTAPVRPASKGPAVTGTEPRDGGETQLRLQDGAEINSSRAIDAAAERGRHARAGAAGPIRQLRATHIAFSREALHD